MEFKKKLVFTDDAKAMTVEIIGFKSFVKSAGNKHVTFTQFSTHREVHASQELALELKTYAS